MTNLEFMKILIDLGYVTKTEFAKAKGLDYSNLIGTLMGRKHNPDTLRALATIGVKEADLPIE